MQTLAKWNYEKHEYDEYEVPKEWNVKLYSEDMKEIINCPHCGETLEYGNSYTSLEIHNYLGFGFAVCSKCYDEEWGRKRNASEN